MSLLFAVIGLVTGTLFVPGRGKGITLHRIWARIVSALILVGFAGALLLVFRGRRKRSE
jgi:hypothetical protein